MSPSLRLDELARLVAESLDDPDPHRAEGRLLALVVGEGWAQAAALFRARGAAGWTRTRAAGPEDLLVEPDLVEAMRRGELPRELPLGRCVLFAEGLGQPRALALGGCELEEAVLDALEAALQVIALLDPGEPSSGDQWPPALPGA